MDQAVTDGGRNPSYNGRFSDETPEMHLIRLAQARRITELERDLAAAQAVLPCGHHNSLMLKSAETGEPLYCELCDCISRRNDAEKMEAEARAAWSYATTLAVSMHRQHYAEDSPNWQPWTDLVGLLTQIDNMYAGLRNDLEALKVENRRLVGAPLAALLEERYALQIAWETAKKQNSHDMLLSGDEIHIHDEAIRKAGGRK